MSTEVYYFTGTGNTLAAAKAIAEALRGELIPIASLKDSEQVQSTADAVGVAFPVYYAGVPVIVKEFVQKLRLSGRPYMFTVSTFGGASGLSFAVLKEAARENGLKIDACYGVHMPQNAFYKPWEKTEEVLSQTRRRAAYIAKCVQERKRGVFHTNVLMEILLKPLHRLVLNASQKALAQHAGESAELELDQGVRLSGRAFTVSGNCTGCGTCAQVCPADNIRMEDNRPVFGDACENCLACFNWCPKKAIGGSITSGHYYRHPDVTAADMKAQKAGHNGML